MFNKCKYITVMEGELSKIIIYKMCVSNHFFFGEAKDESIVLWTYS